MQDYELWIFECYAKMCNLFNIKRPVGLEISKDIGNAMGSYHRVKYTELHITTFNNNKYRVYKKSKWFDKDIKIMIDYVKKGFVEHTEKDIVITWAEDILLHELCHLLGYTKHSRRFYRKYKGMTNKYVASKFNNVSQLKVRKSSECALENRKLLLKVDKLGLGGVKYSKGGKVCS